jgi:hypothetical protein
MLQVKKMLLRTGGDLSEATATVALHLGAASTGFDTKKVWLTQLQLLGANSRRHVGGAFLCLRAAFSS